MHANENVIVVLIVNKCDLTNQRTVQENDGKNHAEEKGFLFFETPAKESANVKEAFMLLVKKMVEQVSDKRCVQDNQDISLNEGIKISAESIGKRRYCKK
jgi:GTPase SAR1 family protein